MTEQTPVLCDWPTTIGYPGREITCDLANGHDGLHHAFDEMSGSTVRWT